MLSRLGADFAFAAQKMGQIVLKGAGWATSTKQCTAEKCNAKIENSSCSRAVRPLGLGVHVFVLELDVDCEL